MKIEEALALVIRKSRKKCKMSQEELSLRCGLDRSFISLIERGKRKPTLHTIFLIAQALGIKPSVIVQEVEQIIYENNEDCNSN
ncbi:helix-turn-helix domain-containing protein [Thermoactinomyces sp. CICC 10521]|uniref:helix-turn-helix domain-containing protein n=1 Tax=Thermoactinomyces sp. CICC 10521 TaxID=2767426 RepID=UPI001E47D46D|nr:helix-turn-helix transcriptional regulator [Thermoactinomyces sp. CICC 10521]